MTTLKCDLCEATAEGDTFEDWMNALMPHYKKAHADVMKETRDLSEEKQKAHQVKWMSDNMARFKSETV